LMRFDLWIFPFMNYAFGVKSKKSLPSPRSPKDFLFSKIFVVLHFRFKSAIHLFETFLLSNVSI
jgi:hypothetical protein